MRDFRNLEVWQKAHKVTLMTYQITESFPKSEQYDLTNQMRRCSVSIPSNIAEGCGRGTDREFAHFLQISMGSASELEYQSLLSHDLQWMSSKKYGDLSTKIIEVKKMLAGLIKKLKSDS